MKWNVFVKEISQSVNDECWLVGWGEPSLYYKMHSFVVIWLMS